MSNPLDSIVFGEKTVSDLFEEIYKNSKKKDKQINALINELKPLITDLGSAAATIPLIKEYLEIGVKNDEHLIKMTGVLQRIMNSSSGGTIDGGLLTDEELQQLQDIGEQLANENEKSAKDAE
jgi:hypothetical protein